MKVKCPKPDRLREIIDEPNTNSTEVREALEWLIDYLENRRDYHKLQQLKNKHLLRIAKERGLLDEAQKSASDELNMTEPDEMPYNTLAEEEDD